jgi:hypothetical protein
MLETASREIRRAVEAAELRRLEAARLPALVALLDELLSELEELNVLGIVAAPEACRRRAAQLIAEAARLDTAPVLPATVAGLMERVYQAQEAALLRRRRAGWGLDQPARGGEVDA